MQNTNFNRSQVFGYKNGIPVIVEKKQNIPIAAGTVPAIETYEQQAEVAEATTDFVPAWVAFDRKVLRCVHPQRPRSMPKHQPMLDAVH